MKKKWKWIWGLSCFLIVIITAGILSIFQSQKKEKNNILLPMESFQTGEFGEMGVEEQIQKAKGAIVQVIAGNFQGSGVIAALEKEYLYVVTAAHVIQDAKMVDVLFVDGSKVECSDISIVSYADAAYLKLSLNQLSENTLKQCRYIITNKKSFDQLSAEEKIVVIGRKNEIVIAAQGKIEEPWIYMKDFQQYMILANIDAEAGMSGGGVFDSSGYFIGILCGGNEREKTAVLPVNILSLEGGFLLKDE